MLFCHFAYDSALARLYLAGQQNIHRTTLFLFYFHQLDAEVQLFAGHLVVCVKCNSLIVFRRHLYRQRLAV